MKYLLVSALLVFAVSCSSKKKVVEKAPEVVQKTVEEPVKELPEKLPSVVTDTSAPTPETNTDDGGLPEITGDSILDVNCAAGQDSRTLSLIKRTDASGWGVTYTKFGTTKTIAVARNDKGFCEEVVSRVKGTLQSAGFQCDGDDEATAPAAAGEASTEEKSMMQKAKDAAGAAADGTGSMVDKAKDAAGEAAESAGDMVDKAKEAAGEAAEAVKGE